MLNLFKVLRERRWRGRGRGLFSGARISNFSEFGFSSLERVLDGVDESLQFFGGGGAC